jgi:hypothetical protein
MINDMNENQLEIFLELQLRQTQALESIALLLRERNKADNITPNLVRSLREFPYFDWEAIDARVINSDRDGVTEVVWQEQKFIRRSPSNKYGEAIWFSRSIGKDPEGHNLYARLITFKKANDTNAEPIPEKIKGRL